MLKIRVLVVVLGTTAGALALASQAPSGWHALLAAIILLQAVVPTVFFFHSTNDSAVPIFELSCAYYGLFYGLPVFLSDILWPSGEPVEFYSYEFADTGAALSISALSMTVLALAAYQSVYYALRTVAFRRILSTDFGAAGAAAKHVALLAWGATAIHSAYEFVPAIQSLPSFGQLAHPFGFFGLALFIVLAQRKLISPWVTLPALFCVYPIVVLKSLASGLITAPLWYAGAALLALMISERRIPWKTITVAALLVVLSYDAKFAYRHLTWTMSYGTEYKDANIWTKNLLFASLVIHRVTGVKLMDFPDIATEQVYSQGNILRRWRVRLAHVALLSGVMEKTPGPVPYWRGESYRPLIGIMVPRLLWPDKPRDVFGGVFGPRYWGTESSTSVNVPWLVEAYGNFGPWGMVVGMALFGALLALLDKGINARGGDVVPMCAGIAILLPWTYPESNFSLMIASTPYQILGLGLYCLVGLRILWKIYPMLTPSEPQRENLG